MLTSDGYKRDATLGSIGISHTEPAHSRKLLLVKLLVAIFYKFESNFVIQKRIIYVTLLFEKKGEKKVKMIVYLQAEANPCLRWLIFVVFLRV